MRPAAWWFLAAAAAAGFVLGVPERARGGSISEYYLTAGAQSQIAVVQGESVNRIWTTVSDQEHPIAVGATVRTLGTGAGVGHEYTLAGVWTGAVYPTSLASNFYDGTTDGTYNYLWAFSAGAAYRFDLDWTNPVPVFTLGTADGFRLGITYDATDDTFWLSGWGMNGTAGGAETLIENRTRSGALVSFFSTGHIENASLALDPADGTL